MMAFVVELVSCTGSPPWTGTAQALKTPDLSELTRIFVPSGEKSAPFMLVVARKSSIVYCGSGFGAASAALADSASAAAKHLARRAVKVVMLRTPGKGEKPMLAV